MLTRSLLKSPQYVVEDSQMEEEAEDRDSRDSFLSSNFGLARSNKKDTNDCNEEPDYNKGNTKFREMAQNLSIEGQDSKSNPDSDLNHLNALANLDPSSKFGENASLIKDIRLAANAVAEEEVNKVYMCHLCDFKTAYANSLMNHQAVHSDFRPWACTACEYAAKRKQDLKKHLHTVHGMMVESPMLKPLIPGGAGMRFQGNIEMSKEQYADLTSLKRSPPLDQECPPGQPSSPPLGFLSMKRMKEDTPNALTISFPTSLSSHRLTAEPADRELDSPDDNLPVSFPTLSSSSSIKTSKEPPKSESPPLPKYLPGKEEGELVFNGAHPHFSWHLNSRRDRFSDSTSVNIPRDWASLPIKKEIHPQASSFAVVDGNSPQSLCVNKAQVFERREDSFHHSFSLSDDDTSVRDPIGTSEIDRSITSSSVVGQGRSTQTPTGFLCEHCDILFFQRAMYVMHIGLHAPDNPWCCAVCGKTFSEKYSFTSHFINQH